MSSELESDVCYHVDCCSIWSMIATEVTAGLAESNGSLPLGGWLSPTGWLSVHRDQLRVQHLITSMGELSNFFYINQWLVTTLLTLLSDADIIHHCYFLVTANT